MRCLGCEVGPVASRSTVWCLRGGFWKKEKEEAKGGNKAKERQARVSNGEVSKGGLVIMGRSVCLLVKATMQLQASSSRG